MDTPSEHAMDVLFAVNLVFDFFYFWFAASFVRGRPQLWRVSLVAVLGAGLAMLPVWVAWLGWLTAGPSLVLLSILLVILIAWPCTLAQMAAIYGGFWLAFGLAGLACEVLAVQFNALAPHSILLVGAGVGVVLIGGQIVWREHWSPRRYQSSSFRRLRIRLGNRSAIVRGLLDSGNLLSTLGGDRAVAVVEVEHIRHCLPPAIMAAMAAGWDSLDTVPADGPRCQLICFTSLGMGQATLLALFPDGLEIWEERRREWVPVQGAIGLTLQVLDSHGRYQALIPLPMVQEAN